MKTPRTTLQNSDSNEVRSNCFTSFIDLGNEGFLKYLLFWNYNSRMYEMRVCLFSPKIQKFLLKVFHIIKKILILTFFQRGYKKSPLPHQSYSLKMIIGIFSLSDFFLYPTPPPHMYIYTYLIDVTCYVHKYLFPPKLVWTKTTYNILYFLHSLNNMLWKSLHISVHIIIWLKSLTLWI